MQSIWDDFVVWGTLIKQMVSPMSAGKQTVTLYISWGETGYAMQENALHWLTVPTRLPP